MEIKAELRNYTEEQKLDFIVEYNHNMGYEIRYTEEEETIEPTEEGEEPQIVTVKVIQAWGYTEEEKQEQERERIANLSLTKRDVFLALYKDKGITPEQIKAQITNPEALIEFEYASSYYRGNPLIDAIGQTLGYTSEQLDYLFEHKELPTTEEV